ncbi:conserved hypothetical protein [Burkholderia cepacia]|nr:conserved hypothetical protein [Burkholderia cepacia]
MVCSAWAVTAAQASAAAAQRESFQFMTVLPFWIEAMKIGTRRPRPGAGSAFEAGGRHAAARRVLHAKYRLKVYDRL